MIQSKLDRALCRGIWLVVCVFTLTTNINAEQPYSFSTWTNGWRKSAQDDNADVLQIETSLYGLAIDVDDLSSPRLGRLAGQTSYAEAALANLTPVQRMAEARFTIELQIGAQSFTANTCAAGSRDDAKRLGQVRMWESGRFVEHFDFLDLDFRNRDGNHADVQSRLELVTWPDRVVFHLLASDLQENQSCCLRLKLDSELGVWSAEQKVDPKSPSGMEHRVSLYCRVGETKPLENIPLTISAHDGTMVKPVWDAKFDCVSARFGKIQRGWRTGYQPNRGYDEFEITVADPDQAADRSSSPIPFLLTIDSPANITGMSPVLCDVNGRPTGIPLQLSKNWHYEPTGSYANVFAMLPTEPTKYRLRVAYGFYGTLPSASHSQLSLVGYSGDGGNGRWDQFAIGCWGETICFDSDRSLVENAITDIRMLMARQGLSGRQWGWTNAGWGGDWLDIRDGDNHRLHPNRVKTAYLSHGPCMPHMRQRGFYGDQQQVEFNVDVQVARADDYARTFQRLSYRFNRDVDASSISLFSLGRTHNYHTPRLDIGDREGLRQSLTVPAGLAKGDAISDPIQLTGPAPHWIAMTGAESIAKRRSPNGYRAFIIREYRAQWDGVVSRTPSLTTRIHQSAPANIDVMLVPPEGRNQLRAGDRVDMLIELITLPRIADDYYGPNEPFREHLKTNPTSWKTTFREAVGNDLIVDVHGGELKQSYPLVMQVGQSDLQFTISGGVGFIPVRFDGLKSPSGFTLKRRVNGGLMNLDQSLRGNDYWQADFDASTGRYSLTFNLPSSSAPQFWEFSSN